MDEFTALAQKARWGIEKQNMVLASMDEKAALLAQADLLDDSDKANDMRAVNMRRQKANELIEEYQGVLTQIENNREVLKTLW